jgi:hypothetical protein
MNNNYRVYFSPAFAITQKRDIVIPSRITYGKEFDKRRPRLYSVSSDGGSQDSVSYDLSAIMQYSGDDAYFIESVLPRENDEFTALVTHWHNKLFIARIDSSYRMDEYKHYWYNLFNSEDIYSQVVVIPTLDSGYILTGYVVNQIVLLLKMNRNYDSLWSSTYRPRSPYEQYAYYPYDVCELSGGGYVMTGWASYFDHNINIDFSKSFLIRTDRIGNEMWRTVVGSAQPHRYVRNFSMIQTPDGKILTAGSSEYETLYYNTNPTVVCIDSANGAVLWKKSYGYDFYPVSTDGLRLVDYFTTIRLTRDGGVALAGCIQSPDSSAQALFVKTDIDGNEKWRKTYSLGRETVITGMRQAPDGGFVMVGYATNQKLYDSLAGVSFVMKTDSMANFPTGVQLPDASPDGCRLSQNYPNPIGPGDMRTAITWSVDRPGPVRLILTDALGRTIRTLVQSEIFLPGEHTEFLDTRELRSGMYLYRLEIAGRILTRAMMVSR